MAKAKDEVKEPEETKAKTEASEAKTKLETKKVEKPEVTETKDASVAKAGKRSAKAAKETAEKQAKEDRKSEKIVEEKAKPKAKPPRSKLERRSKSYKKSFELVDAQKDYDLKEALSLIKKTSTVKFDASVELHANLNIDPKQADQNVRSSVVLPAGTGKSLKVAVLTENIEEAKKAGADQAGTDTIFAAIDKGKLDFDVLIVTPDLMSKLAKYAKVLGPRGLMPNPKSGSVTNNVAQAVKEAKGGKVEYRADASGIVHLSFGKVSFSEEQLLENLEALLANLKSAKPSGVKGSFIKSVYLTTSMGPSIRLDLTKI